VNLVEEHVERARRYARQRNVAPRVRFLVADYTDTGLPEASFDVVWAQESACHAPDKRALAREAARVLRPGGRMVLAEYVTVPDPDATRADPDLVEWEEAWAMHLASADEWTAALNGAGLVDVVIDDITPKMVRSLRRLDRLCALLGPVARGLHRVGARTDVQQRNIAGSRAMVRALDRGRWRYAIITAARPATG
jgi:SAM-dependent methyltransferase